MDKQSDEMKVEDSVIERALDMLGQCISRQTEKSNRIESEIPDLILWRENEPTSPKSAMYEPSICVIAQGAKRVLLGDENFIYGTRHFLVSSTDLPTIVQVVKASREQPCLGIVLKIDLHEISKLMVDNKLPPPNPKQSSCGMALGQVTLPLLTAFQRLVDILDEPKHIPILADIIRREIYYRLLTGDQGARFRQMASAGSQSQQIARAIDWLKDNFTRALHIDDLAKRVNMSKSTFHHHFRIVTAMTPLQYQKSLRLSEARRLMLSERLDATTAAIQVGYESPSQFSREYSRLFGAPPLRDINKLHKMMA